MLQTTARECLRDELRHRINKTGARDKRDNANNNRKPQDREGGKLFILLKLKHLATFFVAHAPRHNKDQVDKRPNTKATSRNELQYARPYLAKIKPINTERSPHKTKEENS